MDPSKPQKQPDLEDNFGNSDNSSSTSSSSSSQQNQPIIVDKGQVCIHIEGSHTTSTDTDNNESHCSKENKNVKFEDELSEADVEGSAESLLTAREWLEETKIVENDKEKSSDREVNKTNSDEPETLRKYDQLETMKQRHKKTQNELQEIEKENKDIAEKFKQIMERFDSYTKNLNTFEMPAIPSTSQDTMLTWVNERRPKSEIMLRKDWLQPREHKSRFSDYYNKKEKKTPDKTEKPIKTDCKESLAYTEKCSATTATSHLEIKPLQKPVQTLACQTSLDGRTSNYDLSSVAASFTTSRTDMQTSLNNYANADNACLVPFTPPQATKKDYKESQGKPSNESPSSIELTSLTVDETPRHPIHTIHIDAQTTPSPSELRRPPLCQRFLAVISDFCAAVFLCLQVNRDCIFCLGFFVAFVVSASFLTAFFYRTLSMSSSLLHISSQQLSKTNEIPKTVRLEDHPYFRRT